ncbi:UNVERIFIED_CONTAM: hypothetical protein FKN15_020576 [Acipenser sinensis]
MTELEPVLDFASSGRSGRRNALPDVLGSPAGVTPSDLPLKLAELSLAGAAPLPVCVSELTLAGAAPLPVCVSVCLNSHSLVQHPCLSVCLN